MQKWQVSDKKIYYFTTTLLLFTIRNFSFYISQNTTYFLTVLFFAYTLVNIYLYILTLEFLETLEVWDFEIFKILKVKGALVPMCTKSLLGLGALETCHTRFFWGTSLRICLAPVVTVNLTSSLTCKVWSLWWVYSLTNLIYSYAELIPYKVLHK
jgi:hypothetical protein